MAKSVTQSTQVISAARLVTLDTQGSPVLGAVMSGQVGSKPICAGVKAFPGRSQAPFASSSLPAPQAL